MKKRLINVYSYILTLMIVYSQILVAVQKAFAVFLIGLFFYHQKFSIEFLFHGICFYNYTISLYVETLILSVCLLFNPWSSGISRGIATIFIAHQLAIYSRWGYLYSNQQEYIFLLIISAVITMQYLFSRPDQLLRKDYLPLIVFRFEFILALVLGMLVFYQIQNTWDTSQKNMLLSAAATLTIWVITSSLTLTLEDHFRNRYLLVYNRQRRL